MPPKRSRVLKVRLIYNRIYSFYYKLKIIYKKHFNLIFNQSDSTEIKNKNKNKISKTEETSNKRSKRNTDHTEEPSAKRAKTDVKSIINKTDTDLNEINFDCLKLNAIGNKYNLKISSWNVSGIRAVIKV